jgi:hypothetical protein
VLDPSGSHVSRKSTSQGSSDVLYQENQLQIVGRARFKLGNKVQIEVASLAGLGVDQETSAADLRRQFAHAREHVLQERSAKSSSPVVQVDTQPG